ncbi:MAG: metalloregulator ArsR/SmtB family transcription factor [Woeseiaceae bacterium]|nr:metalloregulator ArsR/SmtB family transcription factor [Woeseiaceae bacterium]
MSNEIEALCRQFKALGDPARLRIVALCRTGEVSVGELVDILGQSQPRVSQHLKRLCEAGLLRRFRDGKRVYYRLAADGAAPVRRFIDRLPPDAATLVNDAEQLRQKRGAVLPAEGQTGNAERAVARALIELTVTAPLGDLLDIGCGRGALLKLLASRARRAVGVDIDADARSIARAELYLAGLDNCSLRQGDMYSLPFAAERFDTIILDDVLLSSDRPEAVLKEACRLLRPAGRLVVLSAIGEEPEASAGVLARVSRGVGLRMAPPRYLPETKPEWLLTVMSANAQAAAGDAVAA